MGRRLGLEWRVGLLMAVLVVGLVGAATGALWLRMADLARRELDSAVLRAGDQIDEAVASRLDRLEIVTRLLATDPPFRAYVAEGDVPSILDNLADRTSLYDCDGIVITDGAGITIADSRHPEAVPTSRADSPHPPSALITAALEGEWARGIWTDADGGLSLAAAAPFVAGEAAAVVVLEALDGALAAELRRATGAEVAFYEGSARSLRSGASTLPLSRSQLDRLLHDADLTDAATRRIDVDAEEFVVRATPLIGGMSEVGAGFLTLRSVDRELASFRKIQAALLMVGAAAVPIALVLGMMFARRITRPIALLVRATQRVRAGDYDAPIPPDSGDEVGALAGAFRSMVGQLKEKEEMDAWIGALASRLARDDGNHVDRAPDTGMPTRSVAERTHPGYGMEPGRVLQNRFRILGLLGAGGMGTVWQARDEQLAETVAIKILPPEVVATRPDRIERFRQEIRLARRVTHRNVLRTHELLELEGIWAILMERVEGVPLDRLMERGPLPVSAALRIARQICAGLEAAHAEGVVHRDLKPGNVLVDSTGTVKIADFGLARAIDTTDGLTRDGEVMGTPRYMSPEQATGRPADARSDIYSAGVLFYEMLCGRRPFQEKSTVALLRAHAEAEPPRPTSIKPALGDAIEAVLLKALAKDPARRFATARELSEALEQAGAARVEA